MFLAPKKGPKKYRLVVDLRIVNLGLRSPKFKFEKVEDFIGLVGRGWYLFTLDLVEGYFHQRLNDEAKKWTGWVVRNQETRQLDWYRIEVLPFGISLAPSHFTQLVKCTMRRWRREGIVCMGYIDDWIFAAPTKEEALSLRGKIAKEMAELGWVRHLEKGQWEPMQRVEYLGLIIDSVAGRWYVPQEKINQLKALASTVLERDRVSVRLAARVAGKIMSMSRAVPLAKLCLRETFQDLLEQGVYGERNWEREISLSQDARDDLEFVAGQISSNLGAPLWREERFEVVTLDVTLEAWGGHLDAAHGLPGAGGNFCEAESALPIHMKESLAVLYTLRTYERVLKGKNILIRTDNMWVYWYLRKLGGNGRGWQRAIMNLTKEVYAWALQNDARICAAEWIPSEENVQADAISRFIDHGNWAVEQWVFQLAEDQWGPHSVDRMAAAENKKCLRFNAWRLCPGCEAVNCFTQDWRGENNWVAPPLGMILRVLRLIVEQEVEATLFIPTWDAPWRPLLEEIALDRVRLGRKVGECVKTVSNEGKEVLKNPLWEFELVRVHGGRARERWRSKSCVTVQSP